MNWLASTRHWAIPDLNGLGGEFTAAEKSRGSLYISLFQRPHCNTAPARYGTTTAIAVDLDVNV